MKRNFFGQLLFSLVVSSLIACGEDSFYDGDCNDTLLGTRAEKVDLDFANLDTLNFVSEKDVEAYIRYKKIAAVEDGGDFSLKSFEPLTLGNDVILGYLINYTSNWEIIAADKRAPILLGKGDGQLSKTDTPTNLWAWIESLLYDVAILRTVDVNQEMLTEEVCEKINASVDFWKAITADAEWITGHTNTRSEIILPPELVFNSY